MKRTSRRRPVERSPKPRLSKPKQPGFNPNFGKPPSPKQVGLSLDTKSSVETFTLFRGTDGAREFYESEDHKRRIFRKTGGYVLTSGGNWKPRLENWVVEKEGNVPSDSPSSASALDTLDYAKSALKEHWVQSKSMRWEPDGKGGFVLREGKLLNMLDTMEVGTRDRKCYCEGKCAREILPGEKIQVYICDIIDKAAAAAAIVAVPKDAVKPDPQKAEARIFCSDCGARERFDPTPGTEELVVSATLMLEPADNPFNAGRLTIRPEAIPVHRRTPGTWTPKL